MAYNRETHKNRFRSIICLAAAVILLLSACAAESVIPPRDNAPIIDTVRETLDSYTMDVRLDVKTQTLACAQQTVYRNRQDMGMEQVYFHLYANAFKTESKAPFTKAEMEEALSAGNEYGPYPEGFSEGKIELHEVTVNGNAARYELTGESDGILRVYMPEELKPGQEAEFGFSYTVTIPVCTSRFGYYEGLYNIANFFPIACAYDRNGWNLDPYNSVGDPFYSDTSNYSVSITLPEKYKLAATGIQTAEEKESGGMKRVTVDAPAVRDFVFVAGERYKILADTAGNTTVYSYCLDEKAGAEALAAAVESVKAFNKLFGEYPYGQLSVAQTNFYIGGMEYPNIVFIDKRLYDEKNRASLEYVVAHEVAHQWWYGLVGNNEVSEPWLDEALTEYSTILYYGERYGESVMKSVYDIQITGRYESVKSIIPDKRIDRATHEYDDNYVYSGLAYARGAMMFKDLNDKMGDKFYNALMFYLENYKFKIATKDCLLDSLEKFHDGISDVAEGWIEGSIGD